MDIEKVGELEAVALDSGDARSWALFPHAIFRIAKFARTYDSDADVTKLVASLKYCFAVSGESLILLLIEDGKHVVGHMLVSLESWYGTKFATVSQYELDRAMPRNLADRAMDHVGEWAERHGAQFLQALARNEKVARAFTAFHGFQRDRIMLRKPLSTGVAPDAGNG